MLFDSETRYWQEEYRKGNLDDEDMCGETIALLDGTAERMGRTALRWFLSAMIPMITMGIFGFIQTGAPATYERLQNALISYGVTFGTSYDPTVCLLLEVIVIVILFNILWKRKMIKGA